jgi:hypothetical protein
MKLEFKKQKMPKEKLYVGCKLIRAYPLSELNYLRLEMGQNVSNRIDRPGYLVKYPDGYVSWSPKDVFENAYREVTISERSLF